ncbi:DUF418 domain-containing protein [Leucobacter denitrificans]|uniref:DUF418 domain-containing protein n=2 Tax=Leucobacter denitrificans TaxID=683042 RepID=A0A7G9S7P9_9MICO|nr:DUF418 domain-containing protein [Leucobacter denitrificans]
MLLLIAIANVSLYLWGHTTDGMSMHPIDGTSFDRALGAVATVFIDARVYPMFAFLFGYGMVQFLESRWRRGVDRVSISKMMLRRHLWLIAFGAVHAVLLFEGDILGAYGLTGLILAPIFLWRTERAMKITVWVVGGLLVGVSLLLVAGLLLLDPVVGPAAWNIESSDLAGSSDDFYSAGTESPLLAMLMRLGFWVLGTPLTVLMLTVPLCVLVGMFAARRRWLEGAPSRISLQTAAIVGLGIAIVAGIPAGLITGGILQVGELAAAGYSVLSMTMGMFGGFGFVALFALVAAKVSVPLRGVWLAIAGVGRRSLSFYLFQSVILSPLLSNWGLGLGEMINTSGAFAIATGVWLLSVALAYLLERSGVRGPAEKVLRRLTYGRFDVLRPASLR